MVLLSGGHPKRVLVQGVLFAAGASIGGAVAYGALGAVGGAVPGTSSSVGSIALGIGCLWAVVWYLHPTRVPFPSPQRQVNRRWAEVPLIGAIHFGAVLGVGLVTLIRTPLVWAGAVAVLATGSIRSGIFYGLAFGCARSFQVLRQRFYKPRTATDAATRVLLHGRRYHRAGTIAAGVLALLALGEHL